MEAQTICGFVSYKGDLGLKMASVELSRELLSGKDTLVVCIAK
jgi:hypothetical protein